MFNNPWYLAFVAQRIQLLINSGRIIISIEMDLKTGRINCRCAIPFENNNESNEDGDA